MPVEGFYTRFLFEGEGGPDRQAPFPRRMPPHLKLIRRPDVGNTRELFPQWFSVLACPVPVHEVTFRSSAHLLSSGHHLVTESPGIPLLLLLL